MTTKSTSSKLMDEYPLMVYPSLAVSLGLDEAIFLQQLHYWLDKNGNVRDGHKWVYNTYAQWHAQFPFWSERTIRRVIGKLEELKIIVSTDKYNSHPVDRTKWYRIDYKKLDTIKSANDDSDSPSGQNVHANGTECPPHEVDKMDTSIPETTETIPTETNSLGQKQKRAYALPKQWQLTPELLGWAMEKLGKSSEEVEEEAIQFADYHTAKGSKFVSWDAAWKYWVRNAVKFAQRNTGSTYKAREVKKTPEEINNEKWAEMAAERGLKPNRAEREGRIQVDDAYEAQYHYAE